MNLVGTFRDVRTKLFLALCLAMAFVGSASAQTTGTFTGSELAPATAVVNGFLAVAVGIVIAIAIYKWGKRGVTGG